MGDMAEYDDSVENDEGTEREPLDPNIRKALKNSEANAKAAAAAQAEVERLQREIAFTKAGIPEDGVGAYFRKGYEGDHSPEAIRAEAEKAGILSPPPAQVPDKELEQMRDIQSTSASSLATTTVGYEGWLSKIANASSVEEVMALVNTAPPEAGVQHFAE